jgi:3-phenylpropionate/trans-cinnamate dioxygenase ferredoxin subunit
MSETTFVAVAPLGELRPGFVTTHEVSDRDIVITVSADGVVRAWDAYCPHAEFTFGPGRLTGGGCILECPMHGARFDVEDGSVVKGPAKEPLEAIDAIVEDGIVMVGVDWI